MTIRSIPIGARLIHNTDPAKSGVVCGVDPVGTKGPCVLVHTESGRPWTKVTAADLKDYTVAEATEVRE